MLLWRDLFGRLRGRGGLRSMRVATRRAPRRALRLRKAVSDSRRHRLPWFRRAAGGLAASVQAGAGRGARWTTVAMGRWAAAGKEKSRREPGGRAVSEGAGGGRDARWTTAAMGRRAVGRQRIRRGLVGGSLRWTALRLAAAGGAVGAGAAGAVRSDGLEARAGASWAAWRSLRSISPRTWIRRSAGLCSGAGAMGGCSAGRSLRRGRTSVGFTGARGARTGA